MSISEDYMLERIRPGDNQRSLIGLFKVLAVMEHVYPEPKLQWVAAGWQGRLQLQDLNDEESALAARLMETNKIAEEPNVKFYGEMVGYRINTP